MKHARIIYQGQTFNATEHGGALLLVDGRSLPFDAVTWLPPLAPTPRARTIIALGLNYADHAKELAFKAPDEPLAFLKSDSALIGHRAHTVRPEGVKFMHYECELAVVMGRVAKNVQEKDAYAYVQGYAVANDYAIRDYLENWYRPNFKVKNRPTCTPLGPWLVDAADIADPMNLALQTTVNDVVTQSGNTRDMVFSVPQLIAYFSSFMTLHAGDVILTGTPDGVVDCKVGDVVVTSIEGLGSLVSTICSDSAAVM
jgi:5-oxopent-3-ene-1,2,5-tricarboxylate decarboxylase / 2-hydroxyhepta-2,4-diene-1,7-dioate isomerase